ATKQSERPRLQELLERGLAHAIVGLEIVEKQRMQEIEPHVEGLCALHVPHCHVIRFQDVACRLSELVQEGGAELLLGQKVMALHEREALHIIETTKACIAAKAVINCAGLFSDRIAKMASNSSCLPFKIIPFRGEY